MADMYGQRQKRDGSDLGVGERVTGPSDWQGEIGGMKDRSQTAGDTYQGYGHFLLVGNTASTADLTLGSPWSWDDQLAVTEQPGEWSQLGVTANNSPNANTPSNVKGTIDGAQDWVTP